MKLTSDMSKPVRQLKCYGRVSSILQLLCAQIWHTVQFSDDGF